MRLVMETPRDGRGLIRDRVYDILRKNIMELKLEPGRYISEKEVIEMLQVSRSPIREAFIKLSQDDLIETVPQKGSYISLIDLKHVEESRFVRETLEASIVRQACEASTPEFVLQLQNLIALQVLAVEENNYERLFELDEQFHQTIMVHCEKWRTWALMHQMSTHYNRIRFLRLSDNLNWKIIISEHEDIVEHIRKKTPDKAEQIMRNHLRRVVYEKNDLIEKYHRFFKNV